MKKRAVTLLEVMIVILLIGLIGGAVSYNLKGSLDKGKAFRSKEGAQKLADILNLQHELNPQLNVQELLPSDSNANHQANLIRWVTDSGLVSQPDKFIKDGWNEPYIISLNGGVIEVQSSRLKSYNDEHHIPD